jgi:hypothetical protein
MSAKTAVTQIATALVIAGTGPVADAGHSPNIPTEEANEGELYVACTAAPTTITFQVEISPDNGTTWFAHTALAAITATGNVLQKLTGNLGKLLRVNVTAVTGSFTGSIWFNGKRIDG